MILTEYLHEGTLIKRWSDRNVMIQKVGTEEIYVEAVDLVTSPWEYIETEIPVEEEQPEIPEDE